MKINSQDGGSVARPGTRETRHGCQIAGDVLGSSGGGECFVLLVEEKMIIAQKHFHQLFLWLQVWIST